MRRDNAIKMLRNIASDYDTFTRIPDGEYRERVNDIDIDVFGDLSDSEIIAMLAGVMPYDEVDAIARRKPPTPKSQPISILVMDHLRNAPQPHTSCAIADAINRPRSSTSCALKRLTSAGVVIRAMGRYQAA